VSLSTNSVSLWEAIVACCPTHQFPLQPGRDLAGSGYALIVFLAGKGLWRASLPNSSLSGRADIFEWLAKHEFCFRLGSYCGVLHYPPVFSAAGKGSWRFGQLTNCPSGSRRTLEGSATHQFCPRPGRDPRVCR